MLLGRNCHDEQVAKSARFFQMMDMAGMKQIERPMALDNLFALGAELVENSGRCFKPKDFFE